MGLKIACVTPWNVRCGIYTYSADLSKALANEDVETYIVRLPRFGEKTNEILMDVVDRIPFNEVELVHVQQEYGLYQGFDAAFFTALRMRGKPIVTTMHAVGKWEIDVLIAGVSNQVIVHNEFCANRFQFPNAVTIPHGVEMREPTEKIRARTLLNIEKTAPVIGYLGFISNYKGLENLIIAMSKVQNAGLMLAGGWHTVASDVEYIDRLREWSKELLKERVIWTGYVPEERLPDYYGAMDILVYPSRYSTESGALLHGIGYGRAIIASNIEPFKEKEGALMTFKDADDLAEKIKMLLADENKRKELQANAIKYAEENSWANIAKKHVELYKKVLATPTMPSP